MFGTALVNQSAFNCGTIGCDVHWSCVETELCFPGLTQQGASQEYICIFTVFHKVKNRLHVAPAHLRTPPPPHPALL